MRSPNSFVLLLFGFILFSCGLAKPRKVRVGFFEPEIARNSESEKSDTTKELLLSITSKESLLDETLPTQKRQEVIISRYYSVETSFAEQKQDTYEDDKPKSNVKLNTSIEDSKKPLSSLSLTALIIIGIGLLILLSTLIIYWTVKPWPIILLNRMLAAMGILFCISIILFIINFFVQYRKRHLGTSKPTIQDVKSEKKKGSKNLLIASILIILTIIFALSQSGGLFDVTVVLAVITGIVATIFLILALINWIRSEVWNKNRSNKEIDSIHNGEKQKISLWFWILLGAMIVVALIGIAVVYG